jgi:hypothetical protein
VTYACDCMIFSCILLISNSMVSCAIWKTYTLNVHSWVSQRLQIALVLRLRTRAISIVFEKLTRAYFFQIAHETILLPIQITKITKLLNYQLKLLNYQITKIYRLLAVVLLVLFIKQNGVGILLQRRHWRRRTNRTHSQLRLVCDWPTQILRRKQFWSWKFSTSKNFRKIFCSWKIFLSGNGPLVPCNWLQILASTFLKIVSIQCDFEKESHQYHVNFFFFPVSRWAN